MELLCAGVGVVRRFSLLLGASQWSVDSPDPFRMDVRRFERRMKGRCRWETQFDFPNKPCIATLSASIVVVCPMKFRFGRRADGDLYGVSFAPRIDYAQDWLDWHYNVEKEKKKECTTRMPRRTTASSPVAVRLQYLAPALVQVQAQVQAPVLARA